MNVYCMIVLFLLSRYSQTNVLINHETKNKIHFIWILPYLKDWKKLNTHLFSRFTLKHLINYIINWYGVKLSLIWFPKRLSNMYSFVVQKVGVWRSFNMHKKCINKMHKKYAVLWKLTYDRSEQTYAFYTTKFSISIYVADSK